jgi:hypothetical protein
VVAELFKWALVLALVLNTIGMIMDVGKPRRPLRATDAAAVCVVNFLVVVAVLTFWET